MATGHRKADIRALPCAYLRLDGDVLPFKVRLAQASMARARIREFGCRSIDRTGAAASRIESSVQDEVTHHREIVLRIACTVSFPVKQTDQSRTFGDLSAVLGQDHPRRERWPAAHRARRGTKPSAAQRKAHARSDQQDAFNRIGPRKPLRKNVNTLQQGECCCHIRRRPLHQLALLEAGDELGHGLLRGIKVCARQRTPRPRSCRAR